MDRPKISTRNKLLVLTAVMASLLEIIDTSIVNVSIPTMMGNLGATLDEISWVITGYIIANAVVLPIASWMSEQIGRKVYYTGCIILFTAASVACGLAPNLHVLILFRVVQGFAGGALLPTSQALIYEAFPKEMAGMASALYGMSVMIGPTIGPTLGGYLTDNFGWRSIFNINLPVGIVVMILSYLLVEDVGFDPNQKKAEAIPGQVAAKKSLFKSKPNRTPVDSLGLVLLVAGIGSLQYVLERGNAQDWFSDTSIVICSITAVTSIVGLIWWELHTPHPILQLRHFANVTFRYGVFMMAMVGSLLYGLIFVIPIFANTVLNFTATQTGELFIPGALAAAAMMPIIGSQIRKRDPRVLIGTGVVIMLTAVLFISRFNSQTSVGGMFWPLLLRGMAMAYLFVPINSTVLTQFSGAAIGQAAGMLNLFRQLGGSIFIALLSTLLQDEQVRAMGVMSTHLTYFDTMATQASHMFSNGMHAKMSASLGLGNFSMDAVKILYFKAKKEAFVIAYQKTIYIAGLLFMLSIIPLIKMKPKRLSAKDAIPDAH